jgi:DNA-binding NarL/FixJ family response regulator
MPPNPDLATTSILLIDGNATDRYAYAAALKRCSPDYHIIEATDGEAGLNLYRSRRVDCVVLALELPDMSGFKVLVDLVPIASRPNLAVIMLTNRLQRGLREIALQNGAYTCFVKQYMSGEDLDRAIPRAMAFVGQMPKEDRYRPL